MILVFDTCPSELETIYWVNTFHDLRRGIEMHVRSEMVKAMSFTESLLYTAGQIFGAKKLTTTKELTSVNDMLAFASMVNGQ